MKIHNPFVRTPLSLKILFLMYVYAFLATIYMLVKPSEGLRGGLTFVALQTVFALLLVAAVLVKHPRTWIAGIAERIFVWAGTAMIMSDSKVAIIDDLRKTQPALTPEQMEQHAVRGLAFYMLFMSLGMLWMMYMWYRTRGYFRAGAAQVAAVESV